MDWQEMSKRKSTLNSTSFIRLEAATYNVQWSISQAEKLYNDWKSTGLAWWMKSFNYAALRAAANMPWDAWVKASLLISHLEDMQAEIAVLYKLGNTPTDANMDVAARTLNSSWNEAQFMANLRLIEQNIRIRSNSLKTLWAIPWNIYSNDVSWVVDIYTGQPQSSRQFDEQPVSSGQICINVWWQKICW